MNNITLQIWGREFTLDIDFDCYSGETVNERQYKTFDFFTKEAATLLEDAKKNVEEYILKNQDAPSEIDNIFKYVIPTALYIPQAQEKSTIAILCDYKLDLEHGIAIVFEDGKYKETGAQDIIL